MERKTYSGWTNYETWNLALWIDNDQGSYEHWREQAREAYEQNKAEEHGLTRKENAATDLAKLLESETQENAPQVDGFYADILNAAIGEVNYHEIAEHWIDEVADEIDEDEKEDAEDDDAERHDTANQL